MKTRHLLFALLGCVGSAFAAQPDHHSSHAPRFTVYPLTLGGNHERVAAIRDGMAVGTGTLPGDVVNRAFVWTERNGIQDIGTLGGTSSGASDVEGDTVVGGAALPGDTAGHAFIWNPRDGMVDIGTLGGPNSGAGFIRNGVVVGTSETATGESHVFRWTRMGGMVDLGPLANGKVCFPTGVDHGLVSGYSGVFEDTNNERPVAWNANGEVIDLIGKPFEPTEWGFIRGEGRANGVADGRVVGYYLTDTPELNAHAFVWTRQNGLRDLGTLPGGAQSYALATDNGWVVGLSSGTGFSQHPFLWTAEHGMIDLGTLSNMDGWATHVKNGIVAGWYIRPGSLGTFIWTPQHGMFDVTPTDFAEGYYPVALDKNGDLAVIGDNETSSRSAVIIFKQHP